MSEIQKPSGRRVLVTGADGFIGSHLTELLLEQGYSVRALALYNSSNSWGWLEDIPARTDLEVVTGDIRDPHLCQKIVQGVDLVFHLAALVAIPYSYIAPDSYVDTNVKGTLNICQAALNNKIGRLIVTSTSEVYGSAQYVPIDEKHPLQPQSPYSATKVGADAIAMSFFLSFGLPITIARPFNTYGPRQSARAVIPTAIIQIAKGSRTIKLGDLRPTRDFNFVQDICRGFLLLAECAQAIGEIVNIGSNTEISVKDTLSLIKKIMNADAESEPDRQRLRPETSEVFRLRCDNTKLVRLTGYQPRFSLEKGLRETIAWFLKADHLKKYKADIYNL